MKIKQIKHKISISILYCVGFKNWLMEARKSAFGRNGGVPGSGVGWTGKPGKIVKRSKMKLATLNAMDLKTLFPMTIPRSHLNLQRLRALAYVASAHNTKVLFFFWPLDKALLTKAGVFDEAAFNLSKKMIIEEINDGEDDDVFLVDMVDLLGEQYFADMVGHCSIEGRTRIAEALAPEIVEIIGAASASDQ